uniref:Putative bzip transcription factor nrf1 n=1 Tax=Panstrongylus megistus TaxID=65343 RepID=A0A069DZN9_9HEMI
MLRLKKVYREELLQLAILLSLLRTDRLHTQLTATPALPAVGLTANDEYWEGSDTWWRNGEPSPSVHPKSVYWRDMEEEHDILYYLNGGRAGVRAGNIWQRNVTAYVGLTAGPSTSNSTTSPSSPSPSSSSTSDSDGAVGGSVKVQDFFSSAGEDSDLTQEDMDLIEILWKQDVDMGFSVGEWPESNNDELTAEEEEQATAKIKEPIFKEKEKDKDDSWIRNGYAIDLETGEYILKEERAEPEELSEDEPPSSLLPEPDFSLEEALELVGLNDGIDELLDHSTDTDGTDERDESNKSTDPSSQQKSPVNSNHTNNVASNNSSNNNNSNDNKEGENIDNEHDDEEDDVLSNFESIDELEAASAAAVDLLEGRLPDIFSDLPSPSQSDLPNNFNIKPCQQGRVGYSRTVSMEQRWQDLASLLSLPPEHHPHHLHHHAPPPPHHHHHHHHQSTTGPAGGNTAVPPPPPTVYPHPHHHHHIKTAGLHQTSHLPADQPAGATAPPLSTPPSLATSNSHYGSPLGANNIGSAVASSMNLMTNSSEPMGGEAGGTTFKMENSHDMMYYQQNSTTEMNHSTEGFLSSFLNDEDLQLMDMAMNEGMYTMRMLEGSNNNGTVAGGGGGGSGGADSDSAVSSMDSERVPSLTSDADWMEETNSDSGHTSADHYHPSDYTSAFTKYRWYDYGGYSSSNRPLSGESTSALHRGQPSSVPQKKHHMYGKRIFQDQSPGGGSLNSGCIGSGPLKMEEPASPYMSPPLEVGREVNAHQPELKYSCSVEFSRQTLGQPGIRSTPAQIAAHNHTYHMLPENCGSPQRPLARDKKGRKSEEETHLTRDERRARSLSIPIAVEEIINLPMDEFNERLSKYDLSENQLSLIRDIRRRGKNKVAAQNCRKRKLDQILSLADEVKHMRERKHKLLHERQVLLSERHRVKSKVTQLYRHIFQSLRDNEGNPYSPYEWSLQQTADGTVILVPRSATGNGTTSALLDHEAQKRKHDHHPTDP